MSPEQRSMRARLAAHTLHSKVADPSAHTKPARDAFEKRFLDEVDPDHTLPEDERLRRAGHARRAYFLRLSYAGVKARSSRR